MLNKEQQEPHPLSQTLDSTKSRMPNAPAQLCHLSALQPSEKQVRASMEHP